MTGHAGKCEADVEAEPREACTPITATVFLPGFNPGFKHGKTVEGARARIPQRLPGLIVGLRSLLRAGRVSRHPTFVEKGQ